MHSKYPMSGLRVCLTDVPDRGKNVSLEALNDGPARQMLPA
jgi:hypothetical protein